MSLDYSVARIKIQALRVKLHQAINELNEADAQINDLETELTTPKYTSPYRTTCEVHVTDMISRVDSLASSAQTFLKRDV